MEYDSSDMPANSLLQFGNAIDRRIQLTEELLFMILSYHQVSPCYLNFVTCLSPNASTNNMRSSGFSAQTFFDDRQDRAIPGLGRSGFHFQVSLRLSACFRLKPATNARPGAVPPWTQPQAAVYHHFDVQQARALWILTSPRKSFAYTETHNILWEQIHEVIEPKNFAGLLSDHAAERFRASLDILFAVAEWSCSDFVFYLAAASQQLEKLV
jgi:hypothetical protein